MRGVVCVSSGVRLQAQRQRHAHIRLHSQAHRGMLRPS